MDYISKSERRQISQTQVIPSLISTRLVREQTPIELAKFRKWDSIDLPEQIKQNLLFIAWITSEKVWSATETWSKVIAKKELSPKPIKQERWLRSGDFWPLDCCPWGC